MDWDAALWIYVGGAACQALREIVNFDSSKTSSPLPEGAPPWLRLAGLLGSLLAVLLPSLWHIAAWPLAHLVGWLRRHEVQNADIGGAAMDMYSAERKPPEYYGSLGMSRDEEVHRKFAHMHELAERAYAQRVDGSLVARFITRRIAARFGQRQ